MQIFKSIFSLGFGIRHWYDTFFFSSIWAYVIICGSLLFFKSHIPAIAEMKNDDLITSCQIFWLLPLSIVALIKVIRRH